MKQPFCTQLWYSSPEIVKKLFKFDCSWQVIWSCLLHGLPMFSCRYVNVDAEICCSTCECDLKDWSFKYFSLQHINKSLWFEL
nr:hypothetical protein CFP56_68578 [Quercus suber]